MSPDQEVETVTEQMLKDYYVDAVLNNVFLLKGILALFLPLTYYNFHSY